MHKFTKTFSKTDCIHHKNIRMKFCCGRYERAGVCAIPDEGGVVSSYKTCSTKMKHCKYEKRIPK